jgi:hypothetical protein
MCGIFPALFSFAILTAPAEQAARRAAIVPHRAILFAPFSL